MKKSRKIISSLLVLTVVLSCCVLNVFAASTTRTITITPSKIEDIEAGETITVEVTIDNTAKLSCLDYTLKYDTDVFTIDTSLSEVTWLASFIDGEWYEGLTKNQSSWGRSLGAPGERRSLDDGQENGEISLAWAKSTGVAENYNEPNRVVGKFILTAKETTKSSAVFSLTGSSKDTGENDTPALVCSDVTVEMKKNEAQLPSANIVKADNALIEATKDASNRVTVAALGTILSTNDTKPISKATVTVKASAATNGTTQYPHTFTIPASVLSGTIKVAINVRNVPYDLKDTVTFKIAVEE